MKAAILSIGDELITGTTRDANACWLAERLATLGMRVCEMRLVPDDRAAIVQAITALAGQSDLLLITGGLGPTADDLTREALNDVVCPETPLVEDEAGIAQVEQWFLRRGKSMPAINRVQAMRPMNAALIENHHGTAPGLHARMNPCEIFIMPGVPREMREMFQSSVEPLLRERASEQVLLKRSIHSFGLGESAVAERLGELLARTRSPTVGTTATEGIVSARIYASGTRGDAVRQLDATSREIEESLRPFTYASDDESLAGVVGALLRDRGESLATAESCTGGSLGGELTAISGSSAWYRGGWVTYSNAMKAAQLGVPADLIESVGAVSSPVAEAMARGALQRSQADYALSVTGIAGPDGGSDQKPVGTVFIGLAASSTESIEVRHFVFSGDRAGVRQRTVLAALQMLRFRLLNVASDVRMSFEAAVSPNTKSSSQQRSAKA